MIAADSEAPVSDPSGPAGSVVEIYTDGACSGNPGPGGWGALLKYGSRTKEICGGERSGTTNNRMELMAAIAALESLTRPATVRLHTDSVYVRSGITSWLANWKRNGWRTSDKKPVKNADLWQRLEEAARHGIRWSGSGSRATRATPATSEPTPWPTRACAKPPAENRGQRESRGLGLSGGKP